MDGALSRLRDRRRLASAVLVWCLVWLGPPGPPAFAGPESSEGDDGFLLAGSADPGSLVFVADAAGEESVLAPTSGDDNVVYRLVHRFIPGPADGRPPPCDISNPGPDSATFTNSPFTLPKGRSYVENAPLTIGLSGPGVPQIWSWPFLLRTGITDTCEFRIFGQGPTVVGPRRELPGYSGYQPLGFELKTHLWSAADRLYYPSVGLRTSYISNFASREFRVGNQFAISLLVDQQLPAGMLLEWNLGYFGTNIPTYPGGELPVFPNASLPFLGAQWSLQKKLSKTVSIFYHGYYTGENRPYYPAQITSGCGAECAVTQRLMVYGSYNWSFERYGSPAGGWVGFAYAY